MSYNERNGRVYIAPVVLFELYLKMTAVFLHYLNSNEQNYAFAIRSAREVTEQHSPVFITDR